MAGQQFVDAHVHLWDLQRLRYDWLTPPFGDGGPNGNVAAIASTYLLDDYLAEAASWDVVGMVHVDAGAAPEQALAETDWLQQMADARGMPNGIVAFASLGHPEVETLLAAHAERPNVRGIRQIVSWHPDRNRSYSDRDITVDEAWQHGFGLLARHGLSFDLQAYPGQFITLARLIARHPETQVILNHAGSGVDGDAEWRASMALLASLPNVAVKISGLGFVWRPLDPSAIRDRVLATIDLFGTERCMFASDFPTDRLFGGFDETLGNYADAVADFTAAERQALFAGNANRIYRLGLRIETDQASHLGGSED
jgi:predicted TIM-barrel fold metal-dependent hydrolase